MKPEERKGYPMEYWSANHRHTDLSEAERDSRIRNLLRQISLPRKSQQFDYFAAYQTSGGTSQRSSPVKAQYFSSFSEARDWWASLSRQSYQLSDGDRLVDRISGTKQELLSALGEV